MCPWLAQVTWSTTMAPMTAMMAFWSWLSVLVSCVGLVFLYRTTSADPGAIPVGYATDRRRVNGNRIDEDSQSAYQYAAPASCPASKLSLTSVRNLDSPVLWSGNWNQLCVTCKIVRPLRAKHCAVTNRCIEVLLRRVLHLSTQLQCRYLIIIALGWVMQSAKGIDTIL